MASPFQQYKQGGIEASTGNLVQASGQMAAQRANAIAGFGQNIAEGLKVYNENSQKSEAANAKIQMLGQAYADKIAMYSKDPEIAQSGILDGLIAKAALLQDAPTKGLSQRVMIAHDAETSLSGFGNQLQEWSFLRGRQMEREAQMALDKFKGFKSVSQPAFAGDAEFQVDLNLTPQEAQAQALAKLNRIRKSNPNLQGTDEEFLATWRTAREQALANAKDVHPAVVSAGLEAIQAEKNNAKAQAEAQKNRDLSGVLSSKFWSTEAPAIGGALNLPKFATSATKASNQEIANLETQLTQGEKNYLEVYKQLSDAQKDGKQNTPEFKQKLKEQKEILENNKALESQIKQKTEARDNNVPDGATFLAPVGKTVASMKDYEKTVVSPVEQVYRRENPKKEPTEENIRLARTSATAKEEIVKLEKETSELKQKIKAETDKSYFRPSAPIERTAENIGELVRNFGLSIKEEYTKIDPETNKLVIDKAKIGRKILSRGYSTISMPFTILEELGAFEGKSQFEKDIIKTEIINEELKSGNVPLSTQLELKEKDLAAAKRILAGSEQALQPENPRKTAPKIPLGSIQIGTQEKIQRLSIADRQKQVADFVTSRMGAIDPTDPERKRRLPVSGFDKFYKSLVPEAELREFTTDSGARMLYANGKWEQLKSAEPTTLQDIRKGQIGIYGEQDASGRLVPTEFTEGSGVYIGGMFKGTDASNDKYSEEIANLIDARRGIKRLAEINDRTGEFFSPSAQGEAEVEIMNLSAMLRTDIIGVGTVSNYEQELIKKVIRNPTDFFNLESKDRAILLALAQRVDRRIKSLSASKGLTVVMRDDTGGNKYQALREQYLREKGIL